jgi:hypothetical protein
VRYYLVVHSLEPLRLVRHPFFALRLANEQYELNDFENFQKHFTLMSCLESSNSNDGESVDIYSIEHVRGKGSRADPFMEDFKRVFDEERVKECQDMNYEGVPCTWMNDVQPKIDEVLHEIFECVKLAYQYEPMHPSGNLLHPNSGNILQYYYIDLL